MPATTYGRLFDRLTDLIPCLTEANEGDTFYAPARIKDDMALHCTIAKVQNSMIKVELAHDQLVGGEAQPGPWMVFQVNPAMKTAELLEIQDEQSYDVIYAGADRSNPRKAPLNLYAVNWLATFINLQFVFQPIVNAAVAA